MQQPKIQNVEEVQTAVAYVTRDMDRLARVSKDNAGLAAEVDKVQRALDDFAVWLFAQHSYVVPGRCAQPYKAPAPVEPSPLALLVKERMETERRSRVHPWRARYPLGGF